MSAWAVVPAAGSGRRFGGEVPKQYLQAAGKPLLRHALEALLAHPGIDGAVVALADGDARWPGWTTLHGKPVLACRGGAERADSVLAALAALPAGVADDALVLVHDAARPNLQAGDIGALREALWRALTPQAFRRDVLLRALHAARDAGIVATDEAMAVERLGCRPRLVEGREDNLKVTTPADLALADFLLSRRSP